MPYDFTVLRELRKKKGWTVKDLSEKCGVSYVALSKLERNQGNPELKTLDLISRALGLPTFQFVALAEGKGPVSAKAHRAKLADNQAQGCHVNLDGTRICWIETPAGPVAWMPEIHADDYEHCLVLDGRLKVTIHGTEHNVAAGRGLCWDSFLEHSYEALAPTKFVKVLVPKRG
ncbi:MAG: helix-turn-helix domain-containing protein [Phycisphaerae bacterium]